MEIIDIFFIVIYCIFLLPGIWFPYIINAFLKLGDGTGNESSIVQLHILSVIGSIITWCAIYILIHYIWVHTIIHIAWI